VIARFRKDKETVDLHYKLVERAGATTENAARNLLAAVKNASDHRDAPYSGKLAATTSEHTVSLASSSGPLTAASARMIRWLQVSIISVSGLKMPPPWTPLPGALGRLE
jgi:hypothetical protein